MKAVTEPLQEIAGIAAVFDVKDAAADICLLLHSLQHRGPDHAGIAITDRTTISSFSNPGLLAELLKKEPVTQTAGSAAIGQLDYATCGQPDMLPVCVRAHQGHFALAFSGMLTNTKTLRDTLEEEGLIFQGTSDAELLAHIIQRQQGHLFEKITKAVYALQGSYTFLLMTKSTLYAYRSADGRHPLWMGKADGGRCFASESGALQILSCTDKTEIGPGQLVRLGKGSEKQWKLDGPYTGLCAMEYVYYSRPDGILGPDSVYRMRQAFGQALAETETETADIVIGVPDTAIPAAAQFARALHLPCEIGLIKNRYIGSTFIRPTEVQRQQGMRVRLNAISSIVGAKDIFVVDDSASKGITARRICQLLKEAGAAKVHLRIAAPPICSECHHGIQSERISQLAACQYTEEEMCQLFGADTLRFLDKERFAQCFSGPVCLECFERTERNH